MAKEKKIKDVDFEGKAVPVESRKGLLTMFMIMLGFTFFSASMWVGQQLAEGLDFLGFVESLVLGGITSPKKLLGYRNRKHSQTYAKPADLCKADHC